MTCSDDERHGPTERSRGPEADARCVATAGATDLQKLGGRTPAAPPWTSGDYPADLAQTLGGAPASTRAAAARDPFASLVGWLDSAGVWHWVLHARDFGHNAPAAIKLPTAWPGSLSRHRADVAGPANKGALSS